MFLNPLMLMALASIAAPIVIHLLNSRRVQRIKWAAMQFIQDAVQKNRRRMTLEDILLLLLRCLIVALVALAMARPALRSPMLSLLGQSKVTVAVVIDNSASMAVTDGTTSRFDVSKKIAGEMIASLPGGSSAAVYLASDASSPLLADPTTDLVLAHQTIEQAQRSDRSSNLLPALTQVYEMLARQPEARKEVWIITDGQEMALSQLTEIRSLLDRNHNSIHATFVLDGIPESHNLAVTNVRLADGQFATAEQPLTFEVQVTNCGAAEADSVPVTLLLDGAPSDRAVAGGQIASIPPGQTRSVLLAAKLGEAGYHTVTAQIPHDRMPADDQRTMALRVYQQIKVLLVTSDASDTPQSPTFFLSRVLSPVAASQKDSYCIRTRTVSPQQLDSLRLSDFQVAILADVPSLEPSAVDALTHFAQAGGGIMIFPGPATDSGSYNDRLAPILPAKLTAAHDPTSSPASAPPPPLTLQGGDYVHPIARFWSDPNAGSLVSAHFQRTFRLVPAASSPGSVISTVLNFSDGSPAVLSRQIGIGEVVLFASSSNTAWNDWPVRPSFLPFIYRTISEILDRGERGLNLRVGEAFDFQTTAEYADKDAAIVRPDAGERGGSGAARSSRDMRKVELRQGKSTLTYADTDRAGSYDVTLLGDKPLQLKFAAQPDPRESDLTLADSAQLDSLGQSAQVIAYRPDQGVGATLQRDRVGKELWLPLGLAALALAALEMFLADWFSQTK